ncbi:MAG: pirin family protein [Candidatus Sumerlaeia bacterium]|nr:pirin family protein [Candidatus Sumerlaeia bacterium]
MISYFPDEKLQRLGNHRFQLHRMRPGHIRPDNGGDPGLGPLGTIDQAVLIPGLLVPMHEHRNDEIVSYLWRGQMLHRDSTGDSAMLGPGTVMVMNAGRGFSHEESVPGEPVEMLQIFIRPEAAGLPPELQIDTIHWPPPDDGWRLLVGPQGLDCPFYVRQQIRLLDLVMHPGCVAAVPSATGHDALVYVATGGIAVGDRSVAARSAALVTEGEVAVLSAPVESLVVVFLIDRRAAFSRAGTLSG